MWATLFVLHPLVALAYIPEGFNVVKDFTEDTTDFLEANKKFATRWMDIEAALMEPIDNTARTSEHHAFRAQSFLQQGLVRSRSSAPSSTEPMHSRFHRCLLIGAVGICAALLYNAFYQEYTHHMQTKAVMKLLRYAQSLFSQPLIAIASITILVTSCMLLNWGPAGVFHMCFVWDTLPPAFVVNHYKKTKQEYLQHYTNKTWNADRRSYLGVARDHNPVLNPEQNL